MEEPNYIFIFNIAVLQTIVKEIKRDVLIIREARTAIFLPPWQSCFSSVFEYAVNYFSGESPFYHVNKLENEIFFYEYVCFLSRVPKPRCFHEICKTSLFPTSEDAFIRILYIFIPNVKYVKYILVWIQIFDVRNADCLEF